MGSGCDIEVVLGPRLNQGSMVEKCASYSKDLFARKFQNLFNAGLVLEIQ